MVEWWMDRKIDRWIDIDRQSHRVWINSSNLNNFRKQVPKNCAPGRWWPLFRWFLRRKVRRRKGSSLVVSTQSQNMWNHHLENTLPKYTWFLRRSIWRQDCWWQKSCTSLYGKYLGLPGHYAIFACICFQGFIDFRVWRGHLERHESCSGFSTGLANMQQRSTVAKLEVISLRQKMR